MMNQNEPKITINTMMNQKRELTECFNKIELPQDNVARLTCALPLNRLKSMSQDIGLNVTQVGRDGTA